jgi:hypothetical protein
MEIFHKRNFQVAANMNEIILHLSNRYLLPHMLKTTLLFAHMLAAGNSFFMSCGVFHFAAMASSCHASRIPWASLCLLQKFLSVLFAITRIEPFSQIGSIITDVMMCCKSMIFWLGTALAFVLRW